jgi:hypothetical protein
MLKAKARYVWACAQTSVFQKAFSRDTRIAIIHHMTLSIRKHFLATYFGIYTAAVATRLGGVSLVKNVYATSTLIRLDYESYLEAIITPR